MRARRWPKAQFPASERSHSIALITPLGRAGTRLTEGFAVEPVMRWLSEPYGHRFAFFIAAVGVKAGVSPRSHGKPALAAGIAIAGHVAVAPAG